jgi:hypothetical protein
MRIVFAAVLLGLAVLGTASAAITEVPEIDAAGGVNALVLLSGAVLVIRGRRK